MHKVLFFDFDGTLHESERVYAPAFRSVYESLVAEGLAPARDLPDEMISGWLGAPGMYPWDLLLPDLAPARKKEAFRAVGRHMNENIRKHVGRLYEGCEETLTRLKDAGCTLVVLSNSTHDYMELNREVYGLDRWFEAYYVIEDFPYENKWEMLRDVKDRHPGRQIMIGDRLYDMEAARRCGLEFVGCTFGYAPEGELDEADHIAKTFPEIAEVVLG